MSFQCSEDGGLWVLKVKPLTYLGISNIISIHLSGLLTVASLSEMSGFSSITEGSRDWLGVFPV